MGITDKALQNFQARIAEVIDEYLLLGARPQQLRDVLQQEASSDLAGRAAEIGGRDVAREA